MIKNLCPSLLKQLQSTLAHMMHYWQPKMHLLGQKFIALAGIQQNTFTATGTTMSKAYYSVADVTASKAGEKLNLLLFL